MPPFDPREDELLYVQVADHIAARVDSGDLQLGQRLPAERDLAAEYGVAYLTVRRAMERLREAGRVKTIHGRGTYVASPDPSEDA